MGIGRAGAGMDEETEAQHQRLIAPGFVKQSV